MDLIELEVEARAEMGSGAAGRLRRADKIPAVVYGEGKEARMLSIDGMVFKRKVAGHGASQLFRFQSADSTLHGLMTLVKEVQVEPLKEKVLHIDFLSVTEGKRITVTVPLDVVGEPISVKHGETILNQTLYEIDIECLPTGIPDVITLDVSALNEGDAVHVADLALPEGVELITDGELAVVSVIAKREESLEPAAPAEGAEAAPAAAGAATAAEEKE